MHTSQRISKFYEDLGRLELRFPGKELAKLGYSKGYVSDVINRKKEPSEDFLKAFYKKFSNSSQRSSEVDNYVLPLGEVKVTLKDYIDLLKNTNDKLLTILSSTLGEIHEDSRYALAYQKAWVKYEAEKVSGGNRKKEAEIRYKMSKLVDDEIMFGEEAGNYDETHKQSKEGH